MRDEEKKLDSITLSEYLDKYAETGKEYVRVLQQIIKQNNLTDFDDAKLLPSSINFRESNLILFNRELNSKPSPYSIIIKRAVYSSSSKIKLIPKI